ncbi:A24 family peptidase [Pendulispora rubella]|uniref:A24 family peptidase n=1 Tax=Pendulispora rubella TaxID=2741070 RepID=A0ABZ2L9W8_9BACT
MDIVRTAIWVCYAIAVVAAVWDFFSGRIPNVLTLGGVVVGLALHTAVGYVDGGFHGALRGFGASLTGVAICAAVPLFSYSRREMGGGDVKLLAAIGALCGPRIGFDAEGFAFAILFLVIFPWRVVRSGAFWDRLGNLKIGLGNIFRRRQKQLPYLTVRKLPPVVLGPAILAGLSVAIVRHGIWP